MHRLQYADDLHSTDEHRHDRGGKGKPTIEHDVIGLEIDLQLITHQLSQSRCRFWGTFNPSLAAFASLVDLFQHWYQTVILLSKAEQGKGHGDPADSVGSALGEEPETTLIAVLVTVMDKGRKFHFLAAMLVVEWVANNKRLIRFLPGDRHQVAPWWLFHLAGKGTCASWRLPNWESDTQCLSTAQPDLPYKA